MATASVVQQKPQGKVIRTLRTLARMVPRRRMINGVKRFSLLDVIAFIVMVVYVVNPFDIPGPLDDIIVTFLESLYQYFRNRNI